MKKLSLAQVSQLNHSTILAYQISNLYKHAKPQNNSRRFSDPVNTQIYVHHFQNTSRLPHINNVTSQKRSLTKFERKNRSYDKNNLTELKTRRFQTLPSDIQCQNKFPEEKPKIVTSREAINKKKQFIQIDMLTLQTWYARMVITQGLIKVKENNEKKIVMTDITPIPSKTSIATFIQNYKPQNTQIDINEMVRSKYFGVDFKQKQSLYFGEIKNGQLDGHGVMITRSWIFQGRWIHSQRFEGVQITAKGIYKGKFINGDRSKVGQFYWNNGEYYSGQWQKNKKHGTGIWKSKNGDVYMGQWVKGKVQGYGSHLCKNGQKYQGYFLNFLKHGEGKQYFPNGDYFQGTFKEGYPSGLGTYKWKNGLVYNGQFKEGFRSGKGVIKKEGIQYQGNFIQEKADGMGKIIVYNGDNFIGKFKKGKKEGKGIHRQNKNIYVGSWHLNRFIQKQ